MATKPRPLRSRGSLDAMKDVSSVGDVVRLEDAVMTSMKDAAWTAQNLHRDFDAYDAYDDWQRT